MAGTPTSTPTPSLEDRLKAIEAWMKLHVPVMWFIIGFVVGFIVKWVI